jgi:tetratricopeptide (TPR) repeat protein
LDLDAAREDAQRAIELGAGAGGFELAGWVAHYGRDYDSARRYADEGVVRGGNRAVRASCMALAGRIRHTRGDLADGAARLEEAVAIAPAGIRGMVQVWLAMLLAHRGEPDQAVDLAQRGLLDPHLAHPFASAHGRWTLAYALGVSGHWGAALDAVDELDDVAARQGNKRFSPIAANMRGWLLRGAGQLEAAKDLHLSAVEANPGPTFQEAHYAGLLDLAECHLATGKLDEAGAQVNAARSVLAWDGSMSWRHRNRYRLLMDRIASLSGDHADALQDAAEVAAAAAERGDRRYGCRALLVAAAIEARSGCRPDLQALGAVVERFVPLCGADGWRDLAELAAATGSEEIWRHAEKLAAHIVAETSARAGFDADGAARAVRGQLDRFKA